jgi:hypothetical protein
MALVFGLQTRFLEASARGRRVSIAEFVPEEEWESNRAAGTENLTPRTFLKGTSQSSTYRESNDRLIPEVDRM